MSKSEFDNQKFARSLPEIFVVHAPLPHLPVGAVSPDFDARSTIADHRVFLKLVFYTTPNRIHGFLHHEGPNQLFFMGYECGRCHRVFLVPDSVHDETSLHEAMRHACTESHP